MTYSFKKSQPRDGRMKDGKGEMGKFFKGIGNKLYCVLQLSVQKHFHQFNILNSKRTALQRPRWTEKKEKKGKLCFKYFFPLSLVVV